MLDRLFSEGGEVADWVTEAGEPLTYSGDLSSSSKFSSSPTFLSWLQHDVLSPVFEEERKEEGAEFQEGNSLVVGVLVEQRRREGTEGGGAVCGKSELFDQVRLIN